MLLKTALSFFGIKSECNVTKTKNEDDFVLPQYSISMKLPKKQSASHTLTSLSTAPPLGMALHGLAEISYAEQKWVTK